GFDCLTVGVPDAQYFLAFNKRVPASMAFFQETRQLTEIGGDLPLIELKRFPAGGGHVDGKRRGGCRLPGSGCLGFDAHERSSHSDRIVSRYRSGCAFWPATAAEPWSGAITASLFPASAYT